MPRPTWARRQAAALALRVERQSVGLGADEETRQRRRVATTERVVGRQREHRGRHGHCDREHGGGSPNFVEPWQRRGIVGLFLSVGGSAVGL